jgi:hypothetical protein
METTSGLDMNFPVFLSNPHPPSIRDQVCPLSPRTRSALSSMTFAGDDILASFSIRYDTIRYDTNILRDTNINRTSRAWFRR